MGAFQLFLPLSNAKPCCTPSATCFRPQYWEMWIEKEREACWDSNPQLFDHEVFALLLDYNRCTCTQTFYISLAANPSLAKVCLRIIKQGSDYCQIFAEKIKWTDEKFQNEEFFSTSLFSGEIFVDKDLQKFLQMDFFPLCSFLPFDRQMKFSLLRKKLDHHFKKSFFLLLQTFLFHLFQD